MKDLFIEKNIILVFAQFDLQSFNQSFLQPLANIENAKSLQSRFRVLAFPRII